MLILVVVVLCQLLSTLQTSLPNIVLILADDLGFQDVGFRNSTIQTPHIDNLARTGITLENHYVSSVCAPTRAALLTGRYPARTGFWKGNLPPHQQFGLNRNETLLPEMLQRNGYRTHGVGKWHVGMYSWDMTPVKRGFHTYFGGYLGEQGYFTHKNRVHDFDLRDDYMNSTGDLVDELQYNLTGQYNTHLFTDRAVSIITTHNTSHPLLLYLSYTAPHIPHEAPEEDIERLYPPAEGGEEGENASKDRRVYSTMVTLMDEGIGRVMGSLRDAGMTDNTIVIFSSDNGQNIVSPGSNYPLRGCKGSYLEGGIRSVAVISTPLLPNPGSVNYNLYHVTDWYVTFQQLVRDEAPSDKAQLPLDGVDMWSSLEHNTRAREEVLLNIVGPDLYYSETPMMPINSSADCGAGMDNYNRDNFAIRWGKWKLIAGGCWKFQGWKKKDEGGREGFKVGNVTTDEAWVSGTFLFDLEVDPREMHNVAAENPGIVETLWGKRRKYKDMAMRVPRHMEYSASFREEVVMPWVI